MGQNSDKEFKMKGLLYYLEENKTVINSFNSVPFEDSIKDIFEKLYRQNRFQFPSVCQKKRSAQ